jgi:RHH-type transcriptional regulator, proline utilization regulon repressor / proline dehydrogenase / delta 1-pyrroline-5-carboxylate dehydrogenase
MGTSFDSAAPLPAELAADTIDLVRRWLDSERTEKATGSAALLAGVLKDPDGLEFTIGFIDRVIRPEDVRTAARSLAGISRRIPAFLPRHLRVAVRLGGAAAPALPRAVVPAARRALRAMVAHLVVDARPEQLGRTIERLRSGGARLNINLLGEAVLGDAEADNRLAGTRDLLARDDVDYVSIKISSVVSRLNLWAFDATVRKVADRLLPLYRLAAASPVPKFINLDMEEYHDLGLTVAVFKELLDRPELLGLEAGIVLQAYLPDALAVLQDLTAWAQDRKARGGAGIKVRLVKGANLPMERVDARMHGWAAATYGTKCGTDTNYKRMLDWALRPEHTEAVRLGVAGHNLFDIAFARTLSLRRGVADRVEFEMLLGMAPGQARAVLRETGSLLLYTPVVRPEQFDVAISYLVRRLEENASRENFMSSVFDLHHPEIFDREKNRFLAALAAVDRQVPEPNRSQRPDRAPDAGPGLFANAADSDPALPDIRSWGAEVLARVPGSELGLASVAAAKLDSAAQVDAAVERALAAQRDWAALGGAGRAEVLRRAAVELSRRRGDLIEVAAAETGKTIAEGDPEVSEAVDFANWYALLAEELDAVRGARFVPPRLTVVTPPWNFPIAIPAGCTLGALAAGSAVVIKPAHQARRTAAVMVEALWAAGVPRELLVLATIDEGPVGRHLVSHPAVERLILTGSYDTAGLFRSWRAELPLLAETSGKNAIVVMPSADLDLAAADVVKSAFGHAGQKCSAASLVILVGAAARSRRFRNQLVDAAASLAVGWPADPATEMGPLIEPAGGKLAGGLTELEPGEWWVLQPRRLDGDGRLWSPGIKAGVQPGSRTHQVEFFGPVLGVMTADTLEEAIALQNGTPYGLTAGLHTLDAAELACWLDRVQAGNLYVNRGITGAIVRRQPFGGWKRSAVGPGGKAGGPNYLMHLGSWEPAPLVHDGGPVAITSPVRELLEAAELHDMDRSRLCRAAADDQHQIESVFSAVRDESRLEVERNILRYVPTPVTVRINAAGSRADGLRVIAAGLRAAAPLAVSVARPLSPAVTAVLSANGASHRIEDDGAWLARAASAVDPDGCLTPGSGLGRVRLVGGGGGELARATRGCPDLAVYAWPVTDSGRVEMLPFFLEQSVSITAHRFGAPDSISGTVLR